MNDLLIVLTMQNNAGFIEKFKDQVLSISHDIAPVLLLDDGSSDGSDGLLPELDPLHYIIHQEPLGYGGVFISALTYARDHGYTSMMVFPISTNLDTVTIHEMETRMQSSQIVSGNRLASRSGSTYFDDSISLYRDLAGQLAGITGYELEDPFSPIKGFDLSHMEKFEFTEFGEGFFIQLLVQAAYHSLMASEVECTVDDVSLMKELDMHRENGVYYQELLTSEQYLYPIDGLH